MEELGVIEQVEEPIKCCAGLVVVPKANGKVLICIDLTKLNESVLRKRHPLPAVEPTPAQISGAMVFLTLDTNLGFWQIPLSQKIFQAYNGYISLRPLLLASAIWHHLGP